MWNIKDKICLITGITSGIGLQTAITLAGMGARVVGTFRDEKKAVLAKKTIQKIAGQKIDFLYCDLASFDSIRTFVKEFTIKYGELHVLINNAGIWETEKSLSKDEIEQTFAVNYLAPFLLSNLVTDIMIKSSPARIVNVSSQIYSNGEINFDDLEFSEKYNGYKAYAQSKLCLMYFTQLLSDKLMPLGITVNSLHPGVVSTDIFKKMNNFAVAMLKPFLISSEKGAKTSVYLASSDEVSEISGQYFVKCKPKKVLLKDYENVSQHLWEISEQYVNHKFLMYGV
jgi:NAD(P)-dependent dehydrogenase (short-subunit alcohol dehydrogenase family)